MRASLKWQKIFLLLSPSQPIIDYAAELKQQVMDILGHHYEGYHSKAHLSLLMQYLGHAENFLYAVDDKMNSVNPFTLTVKNLNVFYHGAGQRTIYLDVVNKTPACELWEKLVGKEEGFTPHITIARNLSANDFDRVWTELKHLNYSNHFLCDRLTVLKWSVSQRWDHYMDISFKGR
jgi:2'-5' RNA ligase